MYFATYLTSNSGSQPQIIGTAPTLVDIEKLIMAKISNTFEDKPRIIGNNIPVSHRSIGLPANIKKSVKPITTLEPYSRARDVNLDDQNEYYDENNEDKKELIEIEKDDNIPSSVRFVTHQHIKSYCLPYEQTLLLGKRFSFINFKLDKNDVNVVSIFEAETPFVDFIHVLNTINETQYHDCS